MTSVIVVVDCGSQISRLMALGFFFVLFFFSSQGTEGVFFLTLGSSSTVGC